MLYPFMENAGIVTLHFGFFCFTSFIAIIWGLILQFFFQIHFLSDLHLNKNTGCCSHQNFCAVISLCFFCVCSVYYVVYPRVA